MEKNEGVLSMIDLSTIAAAIQTHADRILCIARVMKEDAVRARTAMDAATRIKHYLGQRARIESAVQWIVERDPGALQHCPCAGEAAYGDDLANEMCAMAEECGVVRAGIVGLDDKGLPFEVQK